MFINLNIFVRSEVTTINLVKNAATVPIFGFKLVRKTMYLIHLQPLKNVHITSAIFRSI